MSARIEYFDGGMGILIAGDGIVTGDDLIAANKTIYASNEAIKKMKCQLCDFTAVTEFNLSSEDIQNIARYDIEAAKTNPKIVVALVGEKDLIYGLSRMWEAYVSDTGFRTMVFRTRAEAETWLKQTVKQRFNIDVAIE